MQPVTKYPVTSLEGMQVGHMLTMNYQTPRQRAVTVVDTWRDHQNIRWIEIADRDDVRQAIAENELTEYDIKSVNNYGK